MKFYKPNVSEFKVAEGKYIPIGLPTIDDAINDLEPGALTIFSGRSNEGKTTVLKQTIAHAIDNRFNVCVINAEEKQQTFENDIWRMVVGNNPEYYELKKVNKKLMRVPSAKARPLLNNWLDNRLTIGEKEDLADLNNLFITIKKQLETGNHDLLIIDNLMALLDTTQAEKNAKQANFVENCKMICYQTGVHIMLVTHPSKEYRPGVTPIMEHISGASEIYAKADNILFITRIDSGEDFANGVNGHVYILKCRYHSTREVCNLHYDKDTATLCEIKDDRIKRYNFNLNTGGHILMDMDVEPPFDL